MQKMNMSIIRQIFQDLKFPGHYVGTPSLTGVGAFLNDKTNFAKFVNAWHDYRDKNVEKPKPKTDPTITVASLKRKLTEKKLPFPSKALKQDLERILNDADPNWKMDEPAVDESKSLTKTLDLLEKCLSGILPTQESEQAILLDHSSVEMRMVDGLEDTFVFDMMKEGAVVGFVKDGVTHPLSFDQKVALTERNVAFFEERHQTRSIEPFNETFVVDAENGDLVVGYVDTNGTTMPLTSQLVDSLTNRNIDCMKI